MLYLKQSTAITAKIGPFLDETDGKTAEDGLTIAQADVRLSKNGGDIAQKNEATSCTHDELGIYGCPLDTTDTGTLGRLQLWVHESGALPVFHEFMVVTANVYDTLCSTDVLQADLTQICGDSQSATDLKDFADAGYDPGTNKVEGVKLADTVTALTGHTAQTGDSYARIGAPAGASVSADVAAVKAETASILEDTAEIGAAGAGLTAVPWNADWDAQVESECNDALVAQDLDHLAKAGTAPAPAADSYFDKVMNKDGNQTFSKGTDSLEAIRDNQAGADTAAIADAVWDEAQSGHTTAGTFGKYLDTEVSGVGGGSAADIADAVWDEDITGHENANTAGRAQSAKFGDWEITNNQLICKGLSGDVLFTFDLTQDGVATEYNPDKREGA